MDTISTYPDTVLKATEDRLRQAVRDAERARQNRVADISAALVRPWFYADLVIHPIRDPALAAALRGDDLPPEIERLVCWSLIRMFAWRLRHGAAYPALTKSARTVLEVAIRCEFRRLVQAREVITLRSESAARSR